MTDNRMDEQLSGHTGQFTEAQVEAAAKEFERVWDENIDSFDPEQHDAMSYIKTAMRAALVAAQGATTEELAKIKPLFENLSREYPNECNKRVKAEAERDAALAAVERVRAILAVPWKEGGIPERWHRQLVAALDGASEPEVKP